MTFKTQKSESRQEEPMQDDGQGDAGNLLVLEQILQCTFSQFQEKMWHEMQENYQYNIR